MISHPLQTLFTIGMIGSSAGGCLSAERSFSLLPKGESGAYQLAGDGYIFAADGDPGPEGDRSNPTWYAVDPTVRLSSKGCIPRGNMKPSRDWAGDYTLQETGLSPLFTVRHEATITLLCTYDVEGDPSNRVAARLKFTVPILFSNVSKRPPVPGLGPTPPPRSDSSCSNESSFTSSYYAHTLPAYSQLFEPNGDRKIDYSLPSYSQHPESNAIELSTF